jgi:gluconate 5-dehydrogenase
MKLFDLKGKAAIVTGGNGGIGLGIARGLAQAGASIAVAGRNAEKNAAAVKALEALGAKAIAVKVDVRDEASCRAMVARAAERFGRIDILVNNAGVTWGAPPEEMPLDRWQKVIDINLTGAFLFAQAAGREMLKREYGRIVNIASIAGLQASVHGPHYAAYAASKAGLMGLTRELAASWGRHNVRVNAIAPGFFRSRLADPVLPFVEPSIKATSPIPRIGAEGELKGVCVFLASDASNYITGQTIVVDGGRTMSGG